MAAIKDLRGKSGMTMAQVRERGGPSKLTQGRFEHGDIPAGVQRWTLNKYDEALGLEIGTLWAVAEGSDDELPVPEMPTVPTESASGGGLWQVEVDAAKLRGLLEAVANLREQLRKLPTITPEVRDAVEEATARQVDLLMDQVRRPADDDSPVSLSAV